MFLWKIDDYEILIDDFFLFKFKAKASRRLQKG